MRIIYLLSLVLALSFWSVAFAIQTDCFTSQVFFMWQLNDVFSCFENRIDALENTPAGSGNATLLNDLGDVVISSPIDDQFVRYDGTKWINESVSGGLGNATILDDLGDVDIVNAQTNDVLKYNGTYWVDNTINEDNTTCTNVGSGSQVYKDGECNFRTIIGSSDISVTQQTDTITVDYNSTLVKLCEVTASSGSNTTLSCSLSATPQAFYIQSYFEANGANQWSLRFNSDSGNNYSIRSSTNGAADTTTVSTNTFASITVVANQGYTYFFNCDNPASNKEKHCYGFRTTSSTGAGNADARIELASKWANTSSNISTIDLVRTTGTATLNTGSYIIVYGVS